LRRLEAFPRLLDRRSRARWHVRHAAATLAADRTVRQRFANRLMAHIAALLMARRKPSPPRGVEADAPPPALLTARTVLGLMLGWLPILVRAHSRSTTSLPRRGRSGGYTARLDRLVVGITRWPLYGTCGATVGSLMLFRLVPPATPSCGLPVCLEPRPPRRQSAPRAPASPTS
jgi:hypothetical protein